MKVSINKKGILIVSCALIIGIIVASFAGSLTQSAAATNGYFNEYNDIFNMELDNNYTAAQGFHIHQNYAFYTKISKKDSAGKEKTRLWMYNLSSGKNSVVYNGDSSNTVFEMGHANSLYVNAGYIYIATMNNGGPSIDRYRYSVSDSKCYLYNKKQYNVYSHDTSKTAPISISGINYAPELGGFILKTGNHIYLGNFIGDKFEWTKHFTADSEITVNSNNGTETLKTSDYTMQGVYYKYGRLYVPMTKTNQPNQSVVVAYEISNDSASESQLKEIPDSFIRITSSKYSKLFEIEEIACYNGEMYANVNATASDGSMSDRIIKLKEFTYQ